MKGEKTPWQTYKTKGKVKGHTKQMLTTFGLFWNWSRGVCYGTFYVSLQHRILSSTWAHRAYGKTQLTFLDFEESWVF